MSGQMFHPTGIYISFFMFTTNLKPSNSDYTATIIRHMKELKMLGYTGFELPIAPNDQTKEYSSEIEEYAKLRSTMDSEGLDNVQIATNVAATRTFDPSSPSLEQRQAALQYLKSRVDITAVLGGNIMMGPLVIPYGVFPVTDEGNPIWSDRLQDHLATRYTNAQPILNELGKYAEAKNVKLAIEPITHWETPGPNTLSQLIEFLNGVDSRQVGVVIDSAHETLDGDGPEMFEKHVIRLAGEGRLHYIQISPPDRGAIHESWIPWKPFLEPILQVYKGPIAVEVFNAIPDFVNSLRLSRRKFWIPGEDPENEYPSAYDIAQRAIDATRRELNKIVCS